MMVEEEKKRCQSCGEDRELEYFWKAQAWCIRCMRAWRRQPAVRAAYRVTEQRWRDRRRRPRPIPLRNDRGQFTGQWQEGASA